MKKIYDTTTIANELKQGSVFFQRPTAAEPTTSPAPEGMHRERDKEEKDHRPKEPIVIRKGGEEEQSLRQTAFAANRKTVNEAKRNAAFAANRKIGEGFDINNDPVSKGSFMLTEEEYDALAGLKRPVGRQLGVRVTLHDLARCAINQLLDDYTKHGEQSFLIRHLKQKKT